MSQTGQRAGAFTLADFVLAATLVAAAAAMTLPSLGRVKTGAGSEQMELAGNLALLRNAIAAYQVDHGGRYPGANGGRLVEQLTLCTDEAGNPSAIRTAKSGYGPYLVAVPRCPVVDGNGATAILLDATPADPPSVTTGTKEGWVYNPATGQIIANTPKKDAAGRSYSTY
ncbi:MAG: hypothetical protein HZB38_03645 [Planctomycetes bacterium]|nr:hypothetical protein [Planctomycetota bacterium]